MQIQSWFNRNEIRSYLLLLLVIALVLVTIYISRRQIERLEQEKPKLGLMSDQAPELCTIDLTHFHSD